jgi:hypothetical protein
MTAEAILSFVRATPFRPFRLGLADGGTLDAWRSDSVRVGIRDVMVFKFAADMPNVYDTWDNVGLALIKSISPIESPAAA